VICGLWEQEKVLNKNHLVLTKQKIRRFRPLAHFSLVILPLFAALILTNSIQQAASSDASVVPAAEPVQAGQIRPVSGSAANANAGEVSCSVDAYVFDIHPNGINVRSGAGKNFDLLGQIKPDANGVIVKVVASNEPWLKIENAERIEGESPFSGSGWVFSSQLAMNTRMKTSLYSRSDTKSKVLASLPADEEVTLVACKADWAKVRYGQYQGWLKPEAQCGSPVTSCS
jgi:SH3-like domain-containing protein